MNENIFLDDFSSNTKKGSLEYISDNFKIPLKDIEDLNWIVAQYSYEDYSGSSYCLFEKDGVLYENYGTHCSCYGLEGQWSPQETVVEAIALRFNEDYHFTKDIKAQLTRKLKIKGAK